MEPNWPPHKGGMIINHNDHHSIYQSAEDWIAEHDGFYNWPSEEEKSKAIKEDSIWTIQWYPDTPIGFYAVAASTFEAALKSANE